MTSPFRPLPAVALAIFAAASLPPPTWAQPNTIAPKRPRNLSPAPPESLGLSPERLARLHSAMQRLVDEKQVAGLVTLLARHGKIASIQTHGPLKTDSIFRIYSMTKPVTGVAMMMLYEEGKWQLNDPVSRYIPAFARLKVYAGKNPDGTPKLEDAPRPMTMRELMTHSGGLGYVLNPASPVDKMIIDANLLNANAPLQTMIDGLAQVPLLAPPGTRWSYSIAVDVQGYLVEKLSGQPLADFFRQRIFAPLGMHDTAFYVPKEKLPRLAPVYKGAGPTLTVDENRPDPTLIPLGPSGGGGLYSTALDYARFCEMLLRGGQFNGTRLLAPRTVEMMRTNHVNPEPLKTMPPGTGWGMDVQVVTDAAAAGTPVPNGTYSWWGIAGTWFWIDPASDLLFVGMVQHQNIDTSRAIHALSRSLVYQALIE